MEMPLVLVIITIATHAVLPCCSLPLSIDLEPDDYIAVNTTLMFLSGTARGGQGSQICTDIIISDDYLVELNETFLLKADPLDPSITIINNVTIVILNIDGRRLFYCCVHQLDQHQSSI